MNDSIKRVASFLLLAIALVLFVGCGGNTSTQVTGRYVRTGLGESSIIWQSGEIHAHIFLLAADEETQDALDRLSTGQMVSLDVVHIYEQDGLFFTEVFKVDRLLLGGKKEPDTVCLEEIEAEESRFISVLEQIETTPRTEWTVSEFW